MNLRNLRKPSVSIAWTKPKNRARYWGMATLLLLGACQSTSNRPTSGTADIPTHKTPGSASTRKSVLPPDALVCDSPERFARKVVGDGHCVALIKKCTNAPNTTHWRPGPKVLSSKLPSGTIIATFLRGKYPNKSGHHAAIYIEHDEHGIWVWDQWQGKAVHKRLIRTRNDRADPGNTAQAYRIVKLAD